MRDTKADTGDLTVTLNGSGAVAARSLEELCRDYWPRVRAERFTDLWLQSPSGSALSVLVSGDAALVLFFRYEGDAGFTSRASEGEESEWTEATPSLSFHLSNGQQDEYPVSWTVPTDAALTAAEAFFASHGAQPANIAWHSEDE